MKRASAALTPDLVDYLGASPAVDGDHPVLTLITRGGEDGIDTAQLGPAEVGTLGDQRVCLVLWAHTGTAGNLRADPRAVLTFQRGNQFVTVSLIATRADEFEEHGSTGFVCDVQRVTIDSVDYAEVVSEPRFVLTDPDATRPRWAGNHQLISQLRQTEESIDS